MRVFYSILVLLVGVGWGAIALAGCGTSGNRTTVDSRSVQVGRATSVGAEITMQPGNLEVRGGAAYLLDARFTYRPAAWKPAINYRVSRGRGYLVVRQPRLQSVTNGTNTWDVRLSDRVPIDLAVTSGPGNAGLNLRSLALHVLTLSAGPGNVTVDAGSPSLTKLELSAGPGNLSVRLTGPWQHNVVATIQGGIGNTTLYLPSGIGVRVTVQGGGFVTAPNFSQQEGAYVNAEFGHSKFVVRVALTAGIGNVVLNGG